MASNMLFIILFLPGKKMHPSLTHFNSQTCFCFSLSFAVQTLFTKEQFHQNGGPICCPLTITEQQFIVICQLALIMSVLLAPQSLSVFTCLLCSCDSAPQSAGIPED